MLLLNYIYFIAATFTGQCLSYCRVLILYIDFEPMSTHRPKYYYLVTKLSGKLLISFYNGAAATAAVQGGSCGSGGGDPKLKGIFSILGITVFTPCCFQSTHLHLYFPIPART